MKKSTGNLIYRVLLVLLCSLVGASSASAFFKPYRGKVIDADTKEPIEGAVVVAVWTREAPTFPTGEDVVFKKARETVTDKNGEFSIKPYHHYSLRPLSKLWLRWIIFKPGYASFAPGRYPQHPKVKWQLESDRLFRPYTVIEIPKLKIKEEKQKYLQAVPPSDVVPAKKIPLLIHAYNCESVSLGLRPIHTKEVPYK
jgi:hypothetical protein